MRDKSIQTETANPLQDLVGLPNTEDEVRREKRKEDRQKRNAGLVVELQPNHAIVKPPSKKKPITNAVSFSEECQSQNHAMRLSPCRTFC